jgi:hypothetical protein
MGIIVVGMVILLVLLNIIPGYAHYSPGVETSVWLGSVVIGLIISWVSRAKLKSLVNKKFENEQFFLIPFVIVFLCMIPGILLFMINAGFTEEHDLYIPKNMVDSESNTCHTVMPSRRFPNKACTFTVAEGKKFLSYAMTDQNSYCFYYDVKVGRLGIDYVANVLSCRTIGLRKLSIEQLLGKN